MKWYSKCCLEDGISEATITHSPYQVLGMVEFLSRSSWVFRVFSTRLMTTFGFVRSDIAVVLELRTCFEIKSCSKMNSSLSGYNSVMLHQRVELPTRVADQHNPKLTRSQACIRK